MLSSSDDNFLLETELGALERVQKQVENVLTLEKTRGIPAYLINDDTYAQVMDSPGADLRDVITVFLATIFASAGIFARENAIDAKRILRITVNHRRLRITKILITLLFTITSAVAVQVTRIVEFRKFDSLKLLEAPVQSHTGWADFPFMWNLQTYIIVMLVIRFVSAICLAFVIAAISSRSKNESISAVISTIIIILPALAAFIDIRGLQYISISWFAETNNFMLHSPIFWIWGATFMLGVSSFCIWLINTEWKPQTKHKAVIIPEISK